MDKNDKKVREIFTQDRLTQLKFFKSFGLNGLMVVYGVNQGVEYVLIHGNVPAFCKTNLLIMIRDGWPKTWLCRLYDCSQSKLQRVYESDPTGIVGLRPVQSLVGQFLTPEEILNPQRNEPLPC